jgi:signal transduction histidine kinase
VEEEYKARVFEMFFRGNDNSKGNGLGLYIVKKAIEKLQGKIHFESTYGVGTSVIVWLPFELAPLESSI